MSVTSSPLLTQVTVAPNTNVVTAAPKEYSVDVVDCVTTVSTTIQATTVEPVLVSYSIVTAGVQGPAGTGGGGTDPAYREYDALPSTSTYYKGWADAATTSTATWRVLKGVEAPAGTFTETYADGNNSLDNVWDDRLILSYS